MRNLFPLAAVQCRAALVHQIAITLFFLFALSACEPGLNDDGSSPAKLTTIQAAVISTTAEDYSAGAHSVISLNKPRTALNNLLPTTSDITVASFGDYFYRIERFHADNITKFNIQAPDTPVWQYSTMDPADQNSSNPHDLVFASDTKAYVLRYGSNQLWVVNPSAGDSSQFKTGMLDLSAYADNDGIAEMETAVIVDNKLFVLLQRIDSTLDYKPQQPYVAVFDIQSGEEIDTATGNPLGVKGIALPVLNAQKMQYLAESDRIYIQAVGVWGDTYTGKPTGYDGGIVALDPVTYQVETVLDDGDQNTHPYGQIFNMAIVSATVGYFVGYHDWFVNTLYRFDPSTGEVDPTTVAGLTDVGIADIALDSNGKLWVSNQTQHGITIINSDDNSVDEALISTSLNPDKITFLQ